MLFRHRARQIHHGQQNENVGLQQRNTDMQPQKNNRDANRTREKKTMVTMSPANMLA